MSVSPPSSSVTNPFGPGVDPEAAAIQAMLATWQGGLLIMDQIIREEKLKPSGVDEIDQARNAAYLVSSPMIAQPQEAAVMPSTSSSAVGSATSVGASRTAEGSAAVYALLVTHFLPPTSSRTAGGQEAAESWAQLHPDIGVSLLRFLSLVQSASTEADQAGAVDALVAFKKKQAEMGLDLTSKWLDSVYELGDALKKIDEKKAIEALQGYLAQAKQDPALLDASHLQTALAVTELALFSASAVPLMTQRLDGATSGPTVIDVAAPNNQVVATQDTTAAIAMIAALFAQVAQAQVILVQIAEKPQLDAKKVNMAFATENGEKILGFVQDPSYHVFLTQLVQKTMGQQNIERNVELVKLTMLLMAFSLIARAETPDVTMLEIFGWIQGSQNPFQDTQKTRGKLLEQIKEHIKTFRETYGEAETEKALMDIMQFMETKPSQEEATDPMKCCRYLSKPLQG